QRKKRESPRTTKKTTPSKLTPPHIPRLLRGGGWAGAEVKDRGRARFFCYPRRDRAPEDASSGPGNPTASSGCRRAEAARRPDHRPRSACCERRPADERRPA